MSAEVPLHTPKRTNIIHNQVQLYCKQFERSDNYVNISALSPYPTFTATLECMGILLGKIPKILYLITPEQSCSKDKYRIDPRHATIKLYDTNGVKRCYYFHGTIHSYKSSYYYNYVEKENQRIFRNFNEYFVVASGIGFSKKYLDEVSLHITIGNESFDKLSEIYNYKHSLHGSSDMLNSDILQDNWLLYLILDMCKNVNWDRKFENNHYHTEKNYYNYINISKKKSTNYG